MVLARGGRSLAVASVLATGAFLPPPADAQRQPVRHYDVGDGLVHDEVRSLLIDSRGLLWIATSEGISRFDGYEFRNYTIADGLSHPLINDVAEGPDGTLWFATNGGGLNRFRRASAPESSLAGAPLLAITRLGESAQSNQVNSLTFDAAGRLWCATDDGLFRTEGEASESATFVRVELPEWPRLEAWQMGSLSDGSVVAAIRVDRRSADWKLLTLVVTEQGVEVRTFDTSSSDVVAMTVARPSDVSASDAVIVATAGGGLLRYERDGPAWTRRAIPTSGLSVSDVRSLHTDVDGRLWSGTTRGVFRLDTGRWESRDLALGAPFVVSATASAAGGVWVGTIGAGLVHLLPADLQTWTADDGLTDPEVRQVIAAESGPVYLVTAGSITEVTPNGVKRRASLPLTLSRDAARLTRADAGGWWSQTPSTILRILSGPPDPALAVAQYAAPTAAGWFANATSADTPFVDSRGRVWATSERGLERLDPGDPAEGAPSFRVIVGPDQARGLKVVHEDRTARLWLAGNEALGLLEAGRVKLLQPGPGLPETRPRAVLVDSRGWLWVGLRYEGVSVTRDPSAPEPPFENVSVAEGLSSNTVWALCEDGEGRVYFGTGRGLDRYDPRDESLRSWSARDGLAGDVVRSCARDANGAMWIGTGRGVSRLNPDDPTHPAPATRAFVTRVRAGDEEHVLPQWGAYVVGGLRLEAARASLVIEFVAPSLHDQRTRYQYRLVGAPGEWSEPSAGRVVSFAGLSPGQYRFEVRAVRRDAAGSTDAALVEFEVLPPFWMRGWFVALVVLIGGAAGLGYHRARLRRAVALEQVRRRIAMDVHDDLGAGLAQVAILSEVARQGDPDADRDRALDTIADLARRMRSSVGDIVWAIDARHDRLGDLVARVRELATGALEAHGVAVRVTSDPDARHLALQPDFRRQVWLFCAEAITNILRHAHATDVSIEFVARPRELVIVVADDGVGLHPVAQGDDGDGLGTLRQRTDGMGGRLEVTTGPGAGVRLQATLPLP